MGRQPAGSSPQLHRRREGEQGDVGWRRVARRRSGPQLSRESAGHSRAACGESPVRGRWHETDCPAPSVLAGGRKHLSYITSPFLVAPRLSGWVGSLLAAEPLRTLGGEGSFPHSLWEGTTCIPYNYLIWIFLYVVRSFMRRSRSRCPVVYASAWGLGVRSFMRLRTGEFTGSLWIARAGQSARR